MLSDELKQNIQTYYSQLLKNKNLQARWGQKQMIAEIARGLAEVELDEEGLRTSEQPAVCVIEAGTGTGKTIAYMVPAIPVAQALGKKLVIATATVALQEQVMYKDLPDILLHSGMKFSYALAKGRGRYLCLSKLDGQLRGSDSQEAMLDLFGIALGDEGGQPDRELYQTMLDKLSEGAWKGDRDDWPEALDEAQWRGVSVEHGQCSGSRCSYFSNCCFFRARDSLQKADCIVANHDLVLADLSLGGGVILPAPEDSIYIFDEAHHLPLKGISHFSHFLRLGATGRWLEQMSGIFGRLQQDAGANKDLTPVLEQAGAVAAEARTAINEGYWLFEQFSEAAESANGRGDNRIHTFEGGVIPGELRETCRGLRILFEELAEQFDKILDAVKECMEDEGGILDRERAEAWFPVIGTLHSRCRAAERLWSHFGAEDGEGEAPFARWLGFSEFNGETEIALSCSPVLAADALGATLWQEAFAVLMTSATLTALGSFDFLSLRAGLPAGSRYSRIASPFDYENMVTLRVPKSGFDPSNAESHTVAIIGILPKILDRKAGALVLFSSRRQMQDVLAGLDPELLALVSSQDAFTKQQLMARHRERIDKGQGSILFGLASLTEGIDLPGDYCTHVVIAKIPFAVPNDPVEATLAHWVQTQGRNAFMEISVPEAATRLVQACGRLVRTETDKGTITILDERLVTRRYGQAILDTLPPYRREFFTP